MKLGQTFHSHEILVASRRALIKRNHENEFCHSTMANRKRPPSEEDSDEIPDLSDCREYSDFIMYFTKSGRFQHHNLMDENRRKGVLSLLTADRLKKLTLERRLSPVNLSLTASGLKQRVYLIALVRASKYIVDTLSIVDV